MRNMRVLQLGKFFPVRGGVEKVMYELMTGLSDRGVCCDMMAAAASGESQEIVVNDCARLICTRSLAKVAATMISPAMIGKLREIRDDYDVIHVHHPDPMAATALWFSGFKGKVVLHWHSDILKQKFFLQFYRPLQQWLLRRADKIVGTTPVYVQGSPWLKGFEDKVTCLPIGIDPVPESADSGIPASLRGRQIVFSLGRLVPYKGFDNLVKAAQYLPDEYVVAIGGDGPLKEELQLLIDELGLGQKVVLLGRISDDLAVSLYEECKIFCLSSVQKTEAFGIVQIEAMSKGKPIVATRIPESGVAWVNEHGSSGINVEPNRPKEIAEAILEITSTEEGYRKFSQGARKRYEKMFTKEMMIDKCLELYNDLWKK